MTTLKKAGGMALALMLVLGACDSLQGDLDQAKKDLALRERQLDVLKAGGSDHSNYNEGETDPAKKGWEGWFAQYDKIMSDIAKYKTGGTLSDGTVVAVNTPIDTLLLGDDVFDRFDNGDPPGSENAITITSDNMWQILLTVSNNTVNASIAGNTVGDMQYMADQILSLGVNSLTIKRAIVNAGANDLANAGSTQSLEVGAATASVIANKVGRLVAALMGSANINKVAVLTPVYRGNLNSNDQMYLRGGLDQTSNPAYGSTPPDFVKDSWDSIKNTSSDVFENDGQSLTGKGYNFIRAMITTIVNDSSMAKAMPKDKGAIHLASALNPQQHGYDYDRIKKSGRDYNQARGRSTQLATRTRGDTHQIG
ncbi:MAG: SGNH/GDSL hydrolase family protein [Spirochaetales bacterium]|jgi:hypothetical protein|nr:SGNH/GDSL hydrolase family protein [Spirochaetales bacterium]